jgi:uncharacterized membrane protein YcgQ (UPF0703/DUF1980 family)
MENRIYTGKELSEKFGINIIPTVPDSFNNDTWIKVAEFDGTLNGHEFSPGKHQILCIKVTFGDVFCNTPQYDTMIRFMIV